MVNNTTIDKKFENDRSILTCGDNTRRDNKIQNLNLHLDFFFFKFSVNFFKKVFGGVR